MSDLFIEDYYIFQLTQGYIDERKFTDKIYECTGGIESEKWQERDYIYKIFREI